MAKRVQVTAEVVTTTFTREITEDSPEWLSPTNERNEQYLDVPFTVDTDGVYDFTVTSESDAAADLFLYEGSFDPDNPSDYVATSSTANGMRRMPSGPAIRLEKNNGSQRRQSTATTLSVQAQVAVQYTVLLSVSAPVPRIFTILYQYQIVGPGAVIVSKVKSIKATKVKSTKAPGRK